MRTVAPLTKKKFRASSTAGLSGLLKIGTVRKLSVEVIHRTMQTDNHTESATPEFRMCVSYLRTKTITGDK